MTNYNKETIFTDIQKEIAEKLSIGMTSFNDLREFEITTDKKGIEYFEKGAIEFAEKSGFLITDENVDGTKREIPANKYHSYVMNTHLKFVENDKYSGTFKIEQKN